MKCCFGGKTKPIQIFQQLVPEYNAKLAKQ